MEQQDSRLEVIKMFYAYNSWCTEQLINALDQLSEEEYTLPGCSGNGSIRDTLAHLIGTQWGWFSWFDKSKTVEQSVSLRITSEDINKQEKVREKWRAVDEQTKNCLKNLTEHSINEIWSASFPNGFTMALPLWQLLFHVANHGTHTRAQIIAAIRRLGHNPGIYEFFRFALGQGI